MHTSNFEVVEYECDDGDWCVKDGERAGCVSYIVVCVTIYVVVYDAVRSMSGSGCVLFSTSRDRSIHYFSVYTV